MPGGSDGLRNEAMPCEIDRVRPFRDFCSGKTIAICGEGLNGVLSAVWCVEEGRSIEVALYVADLHIQGSGDTMARRISSSGLQLSGMNRSNGVGKEPGVFRGI